MADNLKVFGTTYYDVQGQKFTDLDGNEKTYIRPAGTKQIAQNGTADVKKYEFAEVAVPASAVDEGTKQITQNGDGQDVIGYAAVDVNVPGIVPAGTKQINQNGTHDVAQYASAEVNVPNTYAASDEGKVVHNGALTAQTSGTTTENGTVDTTLINSLLVNVSGGGGVTKISDGTFTGAGGWQNTIHFGKKMPQTDFLVVIWAANGTRINPVSSTNRAWVWYQYLCKKGFVHYDLSTDGTKSPVIDLVYPTVGSDGETTTDRSPNPTVSQNGGFVRMTTQAVEGVGNISIVRDTSGFKWNNFGKNSQYIWVTGVTYNWALYYIGSDPTTDIVEVS